MPTVSNNIERKCFVKETEINGDFKVSVYPSLLELDHLSNDMICTVKELFTRFTGDQYIRQRIDVSQVSFLPRLISGITTVCEAHVELQRKLLEELKENLRGLFRSEAQSLDKHIKKLCPRTTDQRNHTLVQNRLDSQVFKYTEKASEKRRTDLEVTSEVVMNRVVEKLDTQVAVPRSPQSENAQSVESVKPEKRIRDTFKSATPTRNVIDSIMDQSGLEATLSTVRNTTTNEDSQGDVHIPQVIAEPQPDPDELTEEEYNAIVARTKLSDPEDIKIEGLDQFEGVFHLELSGNTLHLYGINSTGTALLSGSPNRVSTTQRDGYSSSLYLPDINNHVKYGNTDIYFCHKQPPRVVTGGGETRLGHTIRSNCCGGSL